MQLEPDTTYGSWTGRQLEQFLSNTLIPLRIAVTSLNGPLIVPLWFEYSAGKFLSCSPTHSLLVRSLSQHPQVAFDVSTNDIPYHGVRGRGSASCTHAPDNNTLVRLLTRYTGGTDNTLAKRLLNRSEPETLIQLDVDWCTSWDFGPRMDDITKIGERSPATRL